MLTCYMTGRLEFVVFEIVRFFVVNTKTGSPVRFLIRDLTFSNVVEIQRDLKSRIEKCLIS